MFLTLVPTLTTDEEPLTLRSLITVTVSPSANSLPLASRTVFASLSWTSPGTHSWPHSGQINWAPSSYAYGDWQLGQGGSSLMTISPRYDGCPSLLRDNVKSQ